MFQSLSQFYNSEQWRKFRAGLIQERINKKDGILYDEFNGKPLIKSYDIVLHHKTPLTMQNVNDFSVSLNPENIMIVSQRSHNEIHARFGYVAQRKVYVVYGAPCAGKNTFVNGIKGNSDIVVDIDLIWQCITGGDEYRKPAALKQNAFQLRDCLLDMIKTRAGRWERAFVITGGARKGERMRLIEFLGAEGIYIQETKENCLKRLISDKKRDVKEWTKYIEAWFNDYQE
jgi:hypothetical protein